MTDRADVTEDGQPLTERVFDALVFLPVGVVVTVIEELPHLAARGRARVGVQVNSARTVGRFVVRAGGRELKQRAPGVRRSGAGPDAAPRDESDVGVATRLRSIPRSGSEQPGPQPTDLGRPPVASSTPPPDAHVPAVSGLAIPGFDTLSASQVVQRLDGLNRTELVAVRAYESGMRGRRTILTRVDQLLDERS